MAKTKNGKDIEIRHYTANGIKSVPPEELFQTTDLKNIPGDEFDKFVMKYINDYCTSNGFRIDNIKSANNFDYKLFLVKD